MSESPIKDFGDLYMKYDSDDSTVPFCSLWHYTSADGLMGIVRDKPGEHKKLHFWFSRSDCLNDTSEGTHILSLFREVCSELHKKNDISQPFYEAIKDVEIPDSQFINYPIPPSEGFIHESVLDVAPCHAYICSFSMKEDSLDMWRYYSKGNGGYALKCYAGLFADREEYEFSDFEADAMFCSIRSYKVIYDNEEKKRILRSIITDTHSAYSNAEDKEDDKCEAANAFIQRALQIFQFQFKHECYSSEQEYRFVIFVPYVKPEMLQNELPSIRFRNSNGALIPYIDLTLCDGDTFLEEVKISPYIESESVLATTSDYLRQCGFDCKVELSKLPVRK